LRFNQEARFAPQNPSRRQRKKIKGEIGATDSGKPEVLVGTENPHRR